MRERGRKKKIMNVAAAFIEQLMTENFKQTKPPSIKKREKVQKKLF